MGNIAQGHYRRLRGHLELAAVGAKPACDRIDDELVLMARLGGGEEVGQRGLVGALVAAVGHGSSERVGQDPLSGSSDEDLGAGTYKPLVVEDGAGGVKSGEAGESFVQDEGPVGRHLDAAGEDDLGELTSRDRLDCPSYQGL